MGWIGWPAALAELDELGWLDRFGLIRAFGIKSPQGGLVTNW